MQSAATALYKVGPVNGKGLGVTALSPLRRGQQVSFSFRSWTLTPLLTNSWVGLILNGRLPVQIMREAPLIDSPARLVLASPSQQAANDYFKEKVQALTPAQQDVFYSLRCACGPCRCLLPVCYLGLKLAWMRQILQIDPLLATCNLASCTWCSDWRNEQAGVPKTAYHVFRSNALPKGELMSLLGRVQLAEPLQMAELPSRQPSFYSGHGQQAQGAAVYQTICRINHSCTPNCHYSWDPQGENEV